MDMRTGRIYDSQAQALAAGVPKSDLALIDALLPADATGRDHLLANLKECPDVQFSSGPFKGRMYKRQPNGQLVRQR